MPSLKAPERGTHQALYEEHEKEWWALCMVCFREVSVPRDSLFDREEVVRRMELVPCEALDDDD